MHLVSLQQLLALQNALVLIVFCLDLAEPERQPRDFARQVYQWSGFATQLGAMTGTAIIFPLVFFREDIFTS